MSMKFGLILYPASEGGGKNEVYQAGYVLLRKPHEWFADAVKEAMADASAQLPGAMCCAVCFSYANGVALVAGEKAEWSDGAYDLIKSIGIEGIAKAVCMLTRIPF